MPHTVESLADLNYKRFERRIAWYLVVNRTKDCWVWTSTLMGRGKMPVFPTQDFLGRQHTTYARRFAYDHEFPHKKLQKGERLLHRCPDGLEACVSPYHHIKESEVVEQNVGLKIRVVP